MASYRCSQLIEVIAKCGHKVLVQVMIPAGSTFPVVGTKGYEKVMAAKTTECYNCLKRNSK